jgi:hypothetical protein
MGHACPTTLKFLPLGNLSAVLGDCNLFLRALLSKTPKPTEPPNAIAAQPIVMTPMMRRSLLVPLITISLPLMSEPAVCLRIVQGQSIPRDTHNRLHCW